MLRSLRKLSGFRLRAIDGDLGKPQNWLFDDSHWAVRYLVLDTCFWSTQRRVLVAPLAFREIDEGVSVVSLDGTRKSLEDSSPLERDLNCPCPHEREYAPRFGWLRHDAEPVREAAGVETPPNVTGTVEKRYRDSHLHSWWEVLGCRIHTCNAQIGRISDFVAEDRNWTIVYLVVEIGHWWARKKLLVLPDWIEGVSWEDSLVRVNVAKQLICDAPQFIPSLLIKREYAAELFAMYYGQVV